MEICCGICLATCLFFLLPCDRSLFLEQVRSLPLLSGCLLLSFPHSAPSVNSVFGPRIHSYLHEVTFFVFLFALLECTLRESLVASHCLLGGGLCPVLRGSFFRSSQAEEGQGLLWEVSVRDPHPGFIIDALLIVCNSSQTASTVSRETSPLQ